MLLPLDEQDYMLKHGEINFIIYKKLVGKGLGEYIYFEQFLLDLKIYENNTHYFLGLQYIIQNPTLFFK